jgi:hypothetical protein
MRNSKYNKYKDFGPPEPKPQDSCRGYLTSSEYTPETPGTGQFFEGNISRPPGSGNRPGPRVEQTV